MKRNDRLQAAVDTDDVQAVIDARVASGRGQRLTDAQLRRALEAYRRACLAELVRTCGDLDPVIRAHLETPARS